MCVCVEGEGQDTCSLRTTEFDPYLTVLRQTEKSQNVSNHLTFQTFQVSYETRYCGVPSKSILEMPGLREENVCVIPDCRDGA